jgi:Polysaccharide biosynthesis enzyme WcbI
MSRRIAFVGSCQVTGMAAASRAVSQQRGHDWQIEAYHIGAPLNEREIFRLIQGFDVVISQVDISDKPNAILQADSLRGHVGQCVYMPVFVFTGLHPDMTYVFIQDMVWNGAQSPMHSLLSLACYLLDLPARRAASLFNAYVFAEIGYFSAYEASYAVMVSDFDAAGYDLRGMPERWMETSGPFMYTINHPSISVLSHMVVLALARAGLIAVGYNAPDGVDDYLHQHLVAPVFPELARRIGFSGSHEYLRPLQFGTDRTVSLLEYVQESYADFRGVDRSLLASGPVVRVRDRLSVLLNQAVPRLSARPALSLPSAP